MPIKRFLKVLPVSILFWAALGSPANAGFISLTSQTEVQYSEGQLEIIVEITNHGDEPAYNVQVICNVEGKALSSEVKGELGVEEPWEQVLTTDLALEKRGNYPVLLTIRYTDANQYPFSAISVPSFFYQEAISSKVLGVLRGLEISSKGSTKVEVKNLDAEPKRIQLTFFVPEELSIAKEKEEITLKPRGETDVPLTIKNFSALPGSSYPIFAILEYDSEDHHYSSTASGIIKVVKKDMIVENKTVLMVAGGLLILILVILNLRSRKKRAK